MVKKLKLNKGLIKRVSTLALVGALTTNTAGVLSGCSLNPSNNAMTNSNANYGKTKIKMTSDNSNVEFLLLNGKIVNISDLVLKNLTSDVEIGRIDSILVGSSYTPFNGTLDLIYDEENKAFLVKVGEDTIYSGDVKFIVDDNVYSMSDFTLVNSKTQEEVSEFQPIYEKTSGLDGNLSDKPEALDQSQEDGSVLTDEEFEKLYEELKDEFERRNIFYDEKTEVYYHDYDYQLRDYLLFVNARKIMNTNKELIPKVLAGRDLDAIVDSYINIAGIRSNYNQSSIQKNNSTIGCFSAANVIFDRHEKEVLRELEKRLMKIYVISKPELFSVEVNSLFKDFCDNTKPYYALSSGATCAVDEQINVFRILSFDKVPDDKFIKVEVEDKATGEIVTVDALESIRYLNNQVTDPEKYYELCLMNVAYTTNYGLLRNALDECQSLGSPRVIKK